MLLIMQWHIKVYIQSKAGGNDTINNKLDGEAPAATVRAPGAAPIAVKLAPTSAPSST